jgi:hypothetical protein
MFLSNYQLEQQALSRASRLRDEAQAMRLIRLTRWSIRAKAPHQSEIQPCQPAINAL